MLSPTKVTLFNIYKFLQDNKIQAIIIKRSLINKHKFILNEGKCYIIQSFHIGKNDKSYRATHYKYEINFTWSTYVRSCEMRIPYIFFDFISSKYILKKKIQMK